MRRLLCAAVLCAPSASFAADTVYVDVDNTSGVEDGSSKYPFDTIAEGVAAASTGDTVQVATGTYAETVVVEKAMALLSEEPLGARVLPPSEWKLAAAGASLRGFDFQGAGGGIGVYATATVELQGNQLQGFTYGVVLHGVEGGAVWQNRLMDLDYGVYLADAGAVTPPLISNNLIALDYPAPAGITLDSSSAEVRHNLVSGAYAAIAHSLSAGDKLPTSYLENNLLVDSKFGVQAQGVDPDEISLDHNACEVLSDCLDGVPSSQEGLVLMGSCEADGWFPVPSDYVPSGVCKDGGLGLDKHYSLQDLEDMGFWQDLDAEVAAEGGCEVISPDE